MTDAAETTFADTAFRLSQTVHYELVPGSREVTSEMVEAACRAAFDDLCIVSDETMELALVAALDWAQRREPILMQVDPRVFDLLEGRLGASCSAVTVAE